MTNYKQCVRAHTMLSLMMEYQMKVDFEKQVLSCGVFIVKFECLEEGLEDMLELVERTAE